MVEAPPTEQAVSEIQFAGRIRHFVEKARIACQVHLAHLDKQEREDPLAQRCLIHLEAAEEEIEAEMRQWCRTQPVWEAWGSKVKGCGPMVLGAVMSRVDIKRVNTVSAMWAHFGFAPGQHRVKGEKLTYDAIGKTWCWRMGKQLMMANGIFKAVYDKRRAYEEGQAVVRGQLVVTAKKGKEVKENEITTLHVHNRAERYMIKMFLACLWLVWRGTEGLPVVSPYILGRPGGDGHVHQTLITPQEMVDR